MKERRMSLRFDLENATEGEAVSLIDKRDKSLYHSQSGYIARAVIAFENSNSPEQKEIYSRDELKSIIREAITEVEASKSSGFKDF